MLHLRYNRASDPHQYATVHGDPAAIRDLYWQLTHNYAAQDGTKIGKIKVFNLDGTDVTETILINPWGSLSPATTIEN